MLIRISLWEFEYYMKNGDGNSKFSTEGLEYLFNYYSENEVIGGDYIADQDEINGLWAEDDKETIRKENKIHEDEATEDYLNRFSPVWEKLSNDNYIYMAW